MDVYYCSILGGSCYDLIQMALCVWVLHSRAFQSLFSNQAENGRLIGYGLTSADTTLGVVNASINIL